MLGLAAIIMMLAACGVDPSVPITATVEWASATATQVWEKVTATPTQSATPTLDPLLDWYTRQGGGVAFAATPTGAVGRVYKCVTVDDAVTCSASFNAYCLPSSHNGTITEIYPNGSSIYSAITEWIGADSEEDAGVLHRTEVYVCIISGQESFQVYVKSEELSNYRSNAVYARYYNELGTPVVSESDFTLARSVALATAQGSDTWDEDSYNRVGESITDFNSTQSGDTPTPYSYMRHNIEVRPTNPINTPTWTPSATPTPTPVAGYVEVYEGSATPLPVNRIGQYKTKAGGLYEFLKWGGCDDVYTCTGPLYTQNWISRGVAIDYTNIPSNLVLISAVLDDPSGSVGEESDTFQYAVWDGEAPAQENWSAIFYYGTMTPSPTPTPLPSGQVTVYEGTSTPLPVSKIGRYKRRPDGLSEFNKWTGCDNVHACSGNLYTQNWVSRGVAIQHTNIATNLVFINAVLGDPSGSTGTEGSFQYAVWDGDQPTQTDWSAIFYYGTVTPTPSPTLTPFPTKDYVTVTPGPMSIMKNYNVDDTGDYSDAGVAIRLYYTLSPITMTLSQSSMTYTKTRAYSPQFSKAATGSFPVTIADGATLTFLPRDQLTRATTVPTLTASLSATMGVSPTVITGTTEPGFTVEIRAYRWITVSTGTTPTVRQVVSYFYETANASGLFTATIPLTYYTWFTETWQVWHRNPSGPDQPEDIDTIWQLVPW